MKSLSLEELLDVQVVSATKTAQNVSEAPANITVVTARDMRAWGYTTVAEALDHLLGFYSVDDHVLPNFGVRGVPAGLRGESGIIKVMIDGQSISYRTTSGNWLGAEMVPLSAVERIEVVRGPASALYGADAFMGVVNVILKSGAEKYSGEVGGGVSMVGRNVNGDIDVTGSKRYGKLEVLAGARLHQEDYSGLLLPQSSPSPRIPSDAQESDPAQGLLRRSGVGLLRLGYHWSDAQFLRVTGYFSGLEAGVEFGELAQLVHRADSGSRFSRMQGGLLVNSRWTLTDTVALTVDGSFLTGQKTPRERLEIGSASVFVSPKSSFRAANLQLGAQWRPLDEVTVVGGLELLVDDEELPTASLVLKNDVAGQTAGSSLPILRDGPAHQQLINPGALLQVTWQPVQQYFTVTGGLRYDHHNIYGSQLSGRVGLTSSPVKPINLKLLYGSAFKAPSPELLYALPVVAGDVQGNPALQPQFVHTVEGLINYSPFAWFTLSTNLSYNYLINKAEFLPRGFNNVAQNAARYGSLAWETQVEARYEDRLRGVLGVEWVSVRRDSGLEGYQAHVLGDRDGSYPSFQLKAGAMGKIPLPKVPLQASATVRYVGARDSSSSNALANGGVYSLSPYVLVDATLSAPDLKLLPSGETTVELLARNILNSAGVMPGFSGVDYPVTQRSFFLQLRHGF